jgi:hypothetical protein
MKTAAALLLFPITIATGSIDFTPVAGVRVLDGIKFQQLTFNDNGRKITYEQPSGWTFRAEPNRIVFAPPNVTQADAVIEQSPLEAPQTLDDETMKHLQEQVVRSAPPASQHVEVVNSAKNPVMIDRHETFEVVVSYQIGGIAFRRSVLFLNLPDSQVRFRVSAREQDFDKMYRAFRGSVYSWQWLAQ